MAAMIPVMIGNRIVQMLPPQAMEAIRSGAARMLPGGPATVGAQAAGAQSAGPFTSAFMTNLPPLLQRPGLVGRGVAGALGVAGAAAGGAGSGSRDRDEMFAELDRRGTAGSNRQPTLMDEIMGERGGSPYGTMPPAGSFPGMTNMDGLRNQAPSPYGTMPPAGSFPGMTSMDALRTPQPVARVPIPQELFDTLSSYGAGSPMSQPATYGSLPSADSFSGRAPMLLGAPMPKVQSAAPIPMPPPRPAMPMAPAGAPMQLPSAAPSVRESFMQRLLSGPNYQSNSMPVVTPQNTVNWGDSDNAADFFRAEQAARQLGLLG